MTDINADTLRLVQGDNGSKIKVTITREEDGSAVNLNGATLLLKLRRNQSSTVEITITAEAGETSDRTAGIAYFPFLTADLAGDPGRFSGEVEVTFADSTIETIYEELDINIREDY